MPSDLLHLGAAYQVASAVDIATVILSTPCGAREMRDTILVR